eukprot:TRINITY_DN537_c0_g2_i1.p1 TRINITY_DN537_c0_g2~~TRINITY_DN537_c0_g2_i1.p1  ORF type:complete len:198 (-),score=48.43 TRINITY_DN537_c0_g2_i1:45-638(-)
MGISRDSLHKKRKTGGRRVSIRSKRKFEMGRQPAATKIGAKRISQIRTRGGNFKFRALRLNEGNFTWASESVTRKTRVLVVSYNATSNELIRTNTLVKGAVVQIDATPFKNWYKQYYNVTIGTSHDEEETALTSRKRRAFKNRNERRVLDQSLATQFNKNRIYARISSRPGQCGRCDGYILEGEELHFYLRKMDSKK